MKLRHSDYMLWAKTQQRARYTLATSGVGAFPLGLLPVRMEDLEINGDSTYGHPPLQQAIAQKCGVDPSSVVAAMGTSFANHLAMAALIDAGDEVLMEQPVYELILSTALYLGADVKRFERREENGWRIDPADVRRILTPKTKLIVLTNLHNPSSVLTPEPVLREIGDLAKSVGARVLVDEVYLDAVFDETPRSAFHLGPEFVVTNSLTKVYGMSGLRCGWILAAPDLARRMWRLNDLFASIPAHPAERLSVIALNHLEIARQRARDLLTVDRANLTALMDAEPRLAMVRTDWGTTAFVRLVEGDVEAYIARLRNEFETSVAPGHFFESDRCFRVGMGVDNEMFRAGLERLRLAL